MLWKLVTFCLLISAVCCAVTNPITFVTYGNIGSQTNIISNGYGVYPAILDIGTSDNTGTVLSWFSLVVNNGFALFGGGIFEPYFDSYVYQDHVILAGSSPNLYYGLSVDTTLRFDAQGWVTILWEMTNSLPSVNTVFVTNQGVDSLGPDYSGTLTSSGDSFFDVNDDWVVSYDLSGNSPVTGFSLGRGRFLDYQGQVPNSGLHQEVLWVKNLSFQPFETINLLQVLAVGNHAPGYIGYHDLLSMRFRLHSVLSNEKNFYNYVTVEGHGLLDHLNMQQLFNIANWNFIGAGIAGKLDTNTESRVTRLDGSIEQITLEPGVYCLFEDRVLQVNFRFSISGVVDEIVVFAREHGMSFHASLDLNGQPEFLIDGHPVAIPMARFDGNLVTESAPFPIPFNHIPLSALGEYHVNSLHFKDIFTVVGGHHPDFGGFFNVAVHTRAVENRFPGLLNVPSGFELRDAGFSSSIVPDIWFALI